MAEKRPSTGLQSTFGDAILKKGSGVQYTSGSVKAGSENRGGSSSGSSSMKK
jgi:hypothetical protein